MLSKTKRSKRRNKTSTYALAPLFKGVKEALIYDLDAHIAYPGGITSREPEYASFNACEPYLFKRMKQVLDFDKRIIWSSDTSFEKLSKKSFFDFKASQSEFVLPEPLSQRGNRVLSTARELCTEILGAFSYDKWFDSCSFGKRAAVGLPQRKSYLDERFDRLSGTEMQWRAFDHSLSRDMHLFRAVRERLTDRTLVSEIKATAVPKSFKSARIIAPDTILGGFLSRGLGDYIRKRLEKETHIDLAKQQDRHRLWAQLASKTGFLSTIDMSKASDSFTWRHIECIVPEDWHHALDCVRSRRCNIDGSVVDLKSYMLMGSGHTFPLQTLLFYCLAEAARRLLKRNGKVSVYGDDIIVPTKIADPLIVILEELGFTINSEKSFYDEPDLLRPNHTFFRESCGGDYKGGVDVRPYMPECDLQTDGQVPRNEYLAWCHKMINGLLVRWDPCEIPTVLSYLLTMVNNKKSPVCFVPAWEVDHAGVKHFLPGYLLIGREVSYVKYVNSYPTYFRLTFHKGKRKRSDNERPYLWYSYFLRRNSDVGSTNKLPWDVIPSKAAALYSPSVSLDGESHKGKKGSFRWKKRGQKRLK